MSVQASVVSPAPGFAKTRAVVIVVALGCGDAGEGAPGTTTLWDIGESKALEVEGSERLEDGGRVQIYDKNPVGGFNADQKWLFYRVPDGSRNRYLLVNAASFKVLDAVNKNVDKNGGGVFIRRAVSNDATQVWVLEKAD